jgi:hypothetical protein
LQKETFHLAQQFLHGCIARFAPGIDHNGTLWVQPIQMMAHRFADTPLDAVPNNGFPDSPGNGEPDPGAVRLQFVDAKCREQRGRIACALVVDSSEVFRSQQTDTFRETSDGELPLGADSQFLTATRPAASEHGATVLGLHAGEKAVRLGAMAVIRLKGSFRHLSSIV